MLAGLGTLYLSSAPAESAPPVARFHECKTLHCGPLQLVDCGSRTDGPLLVFSRFPERFLADCGFWAMGQNESLCLTVYRTIDFCTP
jgi:hypothetical protein